MAAEIVVSDPLAMSLEAHRLLFLRKRGPRVLLLVVAIWALSLCLVALSGGRAYAYAVLGLAGLVTLLPPVAYVSGRRMLKGAFGSIPGGAYTYRIDEGGVSWRSPIGASQVGWPGFTGVHRFAALWVLVIAQRQFVVLPADRLDEPTRSLILSKVRALP